MQTCRLQVYENRPVKNQKRVSRRQIDPKVVGLKVVALTMAASHSTRQTQEALLRSSLHLQLQCLAVLQGEFGAALKYLAEPSQRSMHTRPADVSAYQLSR